jgi:hypothetical protein
MKFHVNLRVEKIVVTHVLNLHTYIYYIVRLIHVS